jgi:prepilin-type N-terminal cleavage/methylation domain-containing protein
MTSREFNIKNCNRRGLTLVELLVVVGVVSVLAAIVLPSIKNVLTDRKSSQTAIVVRNFLEAARARAIGKNRTVAVVLERLSSRTQIVGGVPVSETATTAILTPDTNFIPYNACIRMSLAEEPLPVTEAMMPTTVTIRARRPGDGLTPPIPNPGAYAGMDRLLDADQLAGMVEMRIFEVIPSATNIDIASLLGDSLINGSQISFGNSKRRFTVVSPRSPSVHTAHFGSAGDNRIWFSVMNEEGLEGLGERALEPAESLAPGQTSTQFKIYSRPKPIYSEVVQLPRGMCIDLSLSGFANDTLRNTTAANPNREPVYDSAQAPIANPLSDYRVRFASDWISNTPTPLLPAQLRPVYIAFGPDGNLAHVWANERQVPGDPSYVGNLVRIDAVQDIFLHIGRIDRVVLPIDPDPAVLGRNKFAFDSLNASGIPQNLSDLNSYVVRISPKSGSISASPIVSIDTQIGILGLNPSTLKFGDLVELSRRGTYSTNVTAQ